MERKDIDRILKDILQGMIPESKYLCPETNDNSEITICDLMPDDINTLSYPELISDPPSQIDIRRDRLTWEEYSQQEDDFELYRLNAEAAMCDLMFDEQDQEEAKLKKNMEVQIQELLNDLIEGNRKKKLQCILAKYQDRLGKLKRKKSRDKNRIRKRIQKIKKEIKDNEWTSIQDMIDDYVDNRRRDHVLEYLDIQKEKEELITLFEEYEKLKKPAKLPKKKKRRGYRGRKKAVKKPVKWKKPELTEEKKEKIKKRARALAAYIERFCD